MFIFINTYLINGFNATQAAITAGYSKQTSAEQGHRLLRNVHISKAITEYFTSSDEVTQKILNELYKIATADIQDFIEIDPDTGDTKVKPLNDIPKGMTSVISDITGDRKIYENPDGSRVTVHDTYKYKLHDKIAALKDYVKILGLATDKVDITSKGEPITSIDVVIKGVAIED